MRKLIVIALLMVGMTVSAQVTVKVNDQVTINKLYAGMLAGGQFSVDSVHNNYFVSLRIGALATWQPAKWLEIKTAGMYHFGSESSFPFQGFWLKFNPSKKWNIQTGYMASLVTEQRPLPMSGDGHFETFSEAQIPGGGYNVKVHFDPNENLGFGVCAVYRTTAFEYQAAARYKWITASGWYNDGTKKFGSALTLNFSRVYNVTSWRQDEVIANFTCVKLGKNKDYCLFSDNGLGFPSNKLVRSETGFLKSFDSKWVKGLFGISWKNETRSVNGYLFVHI